MHSYTSHPEANRLIHHQVLSVVNHLVSQFGGTLVAIVLMGSYGRGEGSVKFGETGQPEPQNDYDFLLVVRDSSDKPSKELLLQCEQRCCDLTGMRWIDICVETIDGLKCMQLSQFSYDLKNGSCVIYGDEAVLGMLPEYRAEDISVLDAEILLATRMWCFIGTEPISILEKGEITLALQQLFWYQMAKALIAVGESVLIINKCYCSSYGDKRDAVRECMGLPESDRVLIDAAFRYKLQNDQELLSMPAGEVFRMSLSVFLQVWHQLGTQRTVVKSLYFVRVKRGLKEFLLKGTVRQWRGLLLLLIQERFLRKVRQNILSPKDICISVFDKLLLYCVSRRWCITTDEFAKVTAKARLQ